MPHSNPQTTLGSYLRLHSDANHINPIKIYWQAIPLKDRNGKLTNTRIRVFKYLKNETHADSLFNSSVVLITRTKSLINGGKLSLLDKEVNNTTSDHYHMFQSSMDMEIRIPDFKINKHIIYLNDLYYYIIFVDQSTVCGFNSTGIFHPIIVPTVHAAPLNAREIKATTNQDNIYIISWQVPFLKNERMMISEDDYKKTTIVSYTIYWCQGNEQHECLTEYSHEVIPGNTTTFHKLLPLLLDSQWIFAISTEQSPYDNLDDVVSSGMEIIHCIYNTSKNFAFLKMDIQHIASVSSKVSMIKWTELNCYLSYPPYFKEFILTYCQLDHYPSTLHLPRKTTNVTLNGLIEDSNYYVTLQLIDRLNHSLKTLSITFKTSVVQEPYIFIKYILLSIGLIIGCFILVITAVLVRSYYKASNKKISILIPSLPSDLHHTNQASSVELNYTTDFVTFSNNALTD